jgi:hypothetical protein
MDAKPSAKVSCARVPKYQLAILGFTNGPSPQNPEKCAAGQFCKMGGYCPKTHCCLVCKHHLHTICGVTRIEGGIKWSTFTPAKLKANVKKVAKQQSQKLPLLHLREANTRASFCWTIL